MIDRHSTDLVGYLRGKINSNHKLPVISEMDSLEMLVNAATNSNTQSDLTTSIDHVINIGNAKDFHITSVYDKFQHFIVLSACYRMLQVLSLSLQHKIALSNFRKSTKFILTAFTALAPFSLMSYTGYWSSELVIVSLLTSISPYILSNNWSNKIREIDLISTTTEFVFKNSLLNCCLSSLRNMSVTMIINLVGRLFLLSAYFVSSNALTLSKIIALSHIESVFTVRNDIEICRFTTLFNPPYGLSVSTPAHFVTHLLMLEAGWCLGRLAIDIGMGLLQKANIISDARDPFYNRTFKTRTQEPAQAPSQPARARLKGRERCEGAEASESHQYASAQQSKQRTRKAKKLQPAAPAETKHLPQHVARANEELPVIRVPDYPEQPLVPFYPSAQSEPTYGVVANPKARHFNEFTTTLNRAHNEVASPDGLVKCLDSGKQVFSLRPNSNARLVGQKVVEQPEVADALKRVYGYERAWRVREQMRTPTAVPFDKETDHDNLSRTMARFV